MMETVPGYCAASATSKDKNTKYICRYIMYTSQQCLLHRVWAGTWLRPEYTSMDRYVEDTPLSLTTYSDIAEKRVEHCFI